MEHYRKLVEERPFVDALLTYFRGWGGGQMQALTHVDKAKLGT